MMLYVGEKV